MCAHNKLDDIAKVVSFMYVCSLQLIAKQSINQLSARQNCIFDIRFDTGSFIIVEIVTHNTKPSKNMFRV